MSKGTLPRGDHITIMKNRPTPTASILDRITETEVTEWLVAQLAYQRELTGLDMSGLQYHTSHQKDGSIEVTVTTFARVQQECAIGYNEPTVAESVESLKRNIAEMPEQAAKLRKEAAELLARADSLDGKGAQ